MTRPEADKFSLGKRILHAGESRFQIRKSLKRLNLTIIATVEIHDERGVRVDRDYDHPLREFMKARNE
jgi:hypothetical protein